MRMLQIPRTVTLLGLAAACFAATAAHAQQAKLNDRLFLSFAEDATIVQKQWWEAQGEIDDGSDNLPWDRTILRGVVAINPVKNLEVGGRVGFGSTSAPDGIPDGSGATDLDLWGKWNLGSSQGIDFAVGAIATVPTGDETAGLGFDAFSAKAFGSMRYKLPNAVFAANVGMRVTQNGRLGDPDGPRLDGKTSAALGLGVLVPVSKELTLVGELNIETERFRNADSDTRLLGGVNWSPLQRGSFRGALAAGLTNGAPDFQVLVGYAYTF